MAKGITFGICVGKDPKYLDQVYESIRNIRGLMNNNHEVLLAGDHTIKERDKDGTDFTISTSNEKMTLCEAKNMMARLASYDRVCIIHDYLGFQENWLEAVNAYPEPWDVLLSPVKTLEGHRSADWLVNPRYMFEAINKYPEWGTKLMAVARHENGPQYVSGLPYSEREMTHVQYISGGYVLCTRQTLIDIPMNNRLGWGQAEDLEWSERLNINRVRFDLTTDTHIQILKPNKWHCYQMPDEFVEVLREVHAGLQQTRHL